MAQLLYKSIHYNQNTIIMEEQVYQMPRIGDKAPDFEAVTTYGKIKFSDFNKGNWVVMFSHPADFTPVCTTEMSGFAQRHDEFRALNTKLLGLSIDSIFAHVAWVNNVKKNTGVLFDFPIIADLDMKVAKLYGMLQPNESETAAVRAVFFIDPTGKIRLIMYYPLNVGRNMDEILRVLTALQTTDKHGVALPLNWKPGEKVIVPPPKTIEEMQEREKSNYEMVDWYLAKKDL
ncbi:MAG TPA: peroxiredoxin [Prolixibacteraceae bacterium]|nr:peroxiredoxin [Prolixibacteraceae bacterium]